MKIIKCWEIWACGLGDRHYLKYHVSDKAAADAWKSKNPNDAIREKELVIFDSYQEIMDHRAGALREQALAKLTEEEKFSLGIK